MRVSIRIEPTAERQLEFLSAWWRENRPVSHSQQLREAFKRIKSSPHTGSLYTELDGETNRRVQIKRTPYMLYYYVDEQEHVAVIISAWSSQRGIEPPLKLR